MIFVAALSIMFVGAQVTATPDSEFETALGTAGLSTKTARFDQNLAQFYRLGEFSTTIYDACDENPWRIPFFSKTFRDEMSTQIGSAAAGLQSGAHLTGFPIRRSLLGNPNAAEEGSAKETGALKRVLDDLAAKGVVSGPVPRLDSVPAEVQKAAALILSVIPRSLEMRKAAFLKLGDLNPQYTRFAQRAPSDEFGSSFNDKLQAYRGVEMAYLAAGAYDLFLAVQAAGVYLGIVPDGAEYDVQIPTAWGVIRLTGGSDTKHPDRPTLLIIDTGGNDTYINCPANQSASNWASVVLDSKGNDQYLSHEVLGNMNLVGWDQRKKGTNEPGPGGALFGYAVLLDSGGNDVYRTHRPGIGSGRMGMAATIDLDGDDIYDAYVDSEGFGNFGAGILEDVRGNDKYFGFNQVQGCGQTEGFGYLADRAGDDAYVANDQVIDFASPQSAEHNVSMAQGAGNGRRADYLDGHTLAGGVGILLDQEGDDKYSCGVFGQGVGYGRGVGFLWDLAGKDSYYGQWYVQGASAHYAIGVLDDEKGDDSYIAVMNMAQGAGHDFAIGCLLDRAGTDTYKAPNLSLGSGNANGIGIFVEFGGNDKYDSQGITLGKAAEAPKGSLRSRCLCLGVFMDLGGEDLYPPSTPWTANATRTANWTDKGLTPQEGQLGIFWDR
ncbi:MAG: hypothetical protein KF784_04240 [Fimbriimonadaceae bacterium]|nr:hypothetical protein [Fimbriimonadaceae bacterium]